MTINSPNYKMEISVGDQIREIDFENFKFDKTKLNSYDGLLFYLIFSYQELADEFFNLNKGYIADKQSNIISYIRLEELKSCFFMLMYFLNASKYDKGFEVKQNNDDEIFFKISLTNLIMNRFIRVEDGDVFLGGLSDNDETQIIRMVSQIGDVIHMINTEDHSVFYKDKTALTKIK